MLVLKIFKLLKQTNPVWFKKQMSAKINGKRDFFSKNIVNFKAKRESNHNEIYNECINNGLSSETIFRNDWIFKLNTSK